MIRTIGWKKEQNKIESEVKKFNKKQEEFDGQLVFRERK